jgi:uncharacterized protein YjaG (DUF416 family)
MRDCTLRIEPWLDHISKRGDIVEISGSCDLKLKNQDVFCNQKKLREKIYQEVNQEVWEVFKKYLTKL